MSADSSKQKTSSSKSLPFYGPIATLFLALAMYIIVQLGTLLLFMLYPIIYSRSGMDLVNYFERSIFAQFLHVTFVEALLTVLLVVILKLRKIKFRYIGFIAPKLRDIGYTAVGFGYYYPAVLLMGYLISILIPGFDSNQNQQVGFAGAAGSQLILVYIALAVLPPLIEELLFRGFLYTGLRRRMGAVEAGVLVSILFAVAHLGGGTSTSLLWIAALDTFVLSLVLCYLRERTGSLWASIGLHTLKNTIAFIGLFILK